MPSDTLIQYVLQEGSLVAAFFVLICLGIALFVVTVGILIDRRDEREHQRRLAESQERARKIIGDHWADRHIIKR